MISRAYWDQHRAGGWKYEGVLTHPRRPWARADWRIRDVELRQHCVQTCWNIRRARRYRGFGSGMPLRPASYVDWSFWCVERAAIWGRIQRQRDLMTMVSGGVIR